MRRYVFYVFTDPDTETYLGMGKTTGIESKVHGHCGSEAPEKCLNWKFRNAN